MSTSITILHHKEVQNTFNLPTGEGIRKVMVRWYRDQRVGVLAQLRARKSADGLETKDGLLTLPDGTGAALAADLEPVLELVWDEAAQAFGASVGLDPKDWTADNPAVKAVIDEQVKDLADSVTTSLSADVQAAIAQVQNELASGAITEAETLGEYEVIINDLFDGMKSWKARAIAVTEASRATHEMQLLLGAESGQVTGWRWLCAAGACPICLEIEQDCPVVHEGEAFAIIGTDQVYSTITCPPAHPNCLCSLEPVLIDDIQPDTWGVTLIQPNGKKSGVPCEVSGS